MRKVLFKLFISSVLLSGISALGAQNVGIGTATPDPSARLEVSANNAGFLVPRLTSAEIQGIISPAVGLQVYNTTTNCLMTYFPNAGWKSVSCDCQQLPDAGYTTASPVYSTAMPVQFMANHAGGIYNWTFQGGAPTSSNLANPSVLFATAGTYAVKLHVRDIWGCEDSSTTSITVLQCIPGALDAGFTYAPSTVAELTPVNFTPNQSAGVQHQWSFAGASTASSSAASPTTSWTSAGTYTVIHTVTDPATGCIDADTQQVTVIACPSGTQTFSYTGAAQYFTVPPCVSTITVDVYGAQGGVPSGNTASGKGARVQATLQVTGGTQLQVNVGGQGGLPNGGWNGGGSGNSNASSGNRGYGGGGASDIRVSGYGLGDRLVVAGGGGGHGSENSSHSSNSSFYGGAGGQNGSTGTCGNCTGGCTQAVGGSQSAGGAAATGSNMAGASTGGAQGQGGDAAGSSSGYWGGGGGGGGYYGGGASRGCGSGSAGGGAGGSSWVNPLNAIGSPTYTSGHQTGNGLIIISW